MIRRIVFICVVALIGVSVLSSCRSKKPVNTDKVLTDEQIKLSEMKNQLNTLIGGFNNMPLVDIENKLAVIKAINSTDPEVLKLIADLEKLISDKKIKLAEEEKIKKEKEAKDQEEVLDLNTRFDRYLTKIATATSPAEADKVIAEALTYFTSPDADVLIILGTFGNEVDYDKPTTIKKYLEYVKDQKVHRNKIVKIEKAEGEKIKLVEIEKK